MSNQVLIVDDDPELLRSATHTLSALGYDVSAFRSAEEALAEIADPESSNPAAVLLDLQMPEMDGREFYRLARLAGLLSPVIILSTHGAAAASTELGADAALTKPFAPASLVHTVEHVLTLE
jgi:DNA-binding response OmpR family regulator